MYILNVNLRCGEFAAQTLNNGIIFVKGFVIIYYSGRVMSPRHEPIQPHKQARSAQQLSLQPVTLYKHGNSKQSARSQIIDHSIILHQLNIHIVIVIYITLSMETTITSSLFPPKHFIMCLIMCCRKTWSSPLENIPSNCFQLYENAAFLIASSLFHQKQAKYTKNHKPLKHTFTSMTLSAMQTQGQGGFYHLLSVRDNAELVMIYMR